MSVCLALSPVRVADSETARRASRSARLLDALLLAFAAWTLVYHVCVLTGIGSNVALAVWLPAAAFLSRHAARGQTPLVGGTEIYEPRAFFVGDWVRWAGIALAVACAALFAFAHGGRWGPTWLAWVGAALACVVFVAGRTPVGLPRPADDRAVTVLWMVILALLAALTLNPDDDDAFYQHFTAWIGTHGTFPTRDVLFGDQVLPAVYFPPVDGWEPFVGAVAHATGIASADLLYFAIPPLAAALSVLALRRLLHAWSVRVPWAALSVALAFLLAASAENKMLGAFFIGRIWQGKVLLCVLLMPLLLVLLYEYGRRPDRGGLARLFAAGVAGVGLSTTGIFLVPVVALGAMGVLAITNRQAALKGFVAAAVYPLAAGVATLALGGRNPEQYKDADAASGPLPHFALGTDALAFVAVAALLIAPAFIPRRLAAGMVAGVVLIVGLIYAPRVPLAIFHLTDLGRVLWRLVWAIPVAALVGVLAVSLVRGRWRLAPAAALIAAFALVGTAPWSDQSARGLHFPPQLKRFPEEVSAARAALAVARPGDTILAPSKVSQTIGVLSGEVYAVSPRAFFIHSLRRERGSKVWQRLRLQRAIDTGAPPAVSDLRAVGVDVVCPKRNVCRRSSS